MAAVAKPAEFALDIGTSAIALLRREALGWRELARAPITPEGDVKDVSLLRRATGASRDAPDPAVVLWLPSDQVLVRRARLPGDARARARSAVELIANVTGQAPEDLALAIAAPEADGTSLVVAAYLQSCREARAYAQGWGFDPVSVATSVETAAFGPDGAVLVSADELLTEAVAPAGGRPAPASASAATPEAATPPPAQKRAWRGRHYGLLAAVIAVLGALAIYLTTSPGEGDTRRIILAEAPVTAVPPPDPPEVKERPDPAAAATAVAEPRPSPSPPAWPDLALPRDDAAVLVAGLTPRPSASGPPAALAEISGPPGMPQIPAFATGEPDRPAASAADRVPDQRLAGVPPSATPSDARWKRPPTPAQSDARVAGQTAEGDARSPADAAAPAPDGEEAGTSETTDLSATERAPVEVALVPPARREPGGGGTDSAEMAEARGDEAATSDSAQAAAASAGDVAGPGPAVAPPPQLRDDDAAANGETPARTDRAANETADASDSKLAALAAPAPSVRPAGLGAPIRPSPRDGTGRRAPVLPSLGRSAPRAVDRAAVEQGIPLDRTALIGILNLEAGRQALLRLPNGRYERLTVGDTLEGWRINMIGSDTVRLTRNGEDRTLVLVNR